MDLTVDFKSFQDRVQSSLLNATRTAGQISSEDLKFHRSSDPKVSNALEAQNARLLHLTNKLLKSATKDSNISAPKLQGQDGIEDNWRDVVDVIDDLLEKADASLDEFSGVLRRLSPSRQDGTATTPRQSETPKKFPTIFSNSSIRKPQLDFQEPVNNYETAAFKPLLRTKPHALVPLEQAIAPGEDGKYKHPYAFEIDHSQYSQTVYTRSLPLPFTNPTYHKAVFVDTEDGVQDMLAELKLAKEIAVDLEHHDSHSFIGLVSLMQISTREKDWIVDPLKPWRKNLQCLNEVFADPKILKVFHGSTMDMIWLQRDLGLYVVGLFDTFHAAVALDFPKKSLAYLLERFAHFYAQKKYQLADWRVRPLPDELVDYARSDTHYLLFIYDCLRNMLLDASSPSENLVDQVLAGSKKEALQTYERPIYDPEYGLGPVGWFKPLMQRSIKFDTQQFAVYRALHEWRDLKGRALDEGSQHLISLANLWTLAEQMPLSVLDLHKTLRSVPRFISENGKEIVAVIKKAKIDGLTGPSLRDVVRTNEEKFGVTAIWNRKPQTPPQNMHTGIGATLQMLTASDQLAPSEAVAEDPGVLADVSEQELPASRSTSSLLWGRSLPKAVQTAGTSVRAATAALRSVLPLPPIQSSSFAALSLDPIANTPADPAQHIIPVTQPVADAEAAAAAHDTSLSTVEKDEAFVIRDLARSRKRKAEENYEFSTPDLPVLPAEVGQYSAAAEAANGSPAQPIDPILQERIWKQAKAQRKAEKRSKKAETEAAQAQMQAAAPFDYASAESILHAKPDAGANGVENVKAMNPFAKALDTTTGAKRLKQGKEQAGMSKTFKK